MIIYSVTVSIEHEIESEWKNWMLDTHIPAVMDTGYFSQYRFHKILEPVVDPDRISYNVLYSIASLDKLNQYRQNEAPRLQEAHLERYGEQAIAIRVVLDQQQTGESADSSSSSI